MLPIFFVQLNLFGRQPPIYTFKNLPCPRLFKAAMMNVLGATHYVGSGCY